jgi:hypothetical protein
MVSAPGLRQRSHAGLNSNSLRRAGASQYVSGCVDAELVEQLTYVASRADELIRDAEQQRQWRQTHAWSPKEFSQTRKV